jgi:hypothetical protein
MAQSPKWKVYDAGGTYQAACKEIEAAAALMGFYGDGATIRFDHAKSTTVWTEGNEQQPALEGYDYVAETAELRRRDIHAVALRKAGMGHLVE